MKRLQYLFSTGLLGVLFSTGLAAEVPSSEIDFSSSQLYVRYTPLAGAASFNCFGSSAAITVFSRPLDGIGITDTAGISNVISGTSSACFQQSGTYELKFELVDTAGNTQIFPSPDPTNWYVVDIAPADPNPTETDVEASPGCTDLLADGNATCTVTLTIRDQFQNIVTQIDSLTELDVFLGMNAAQVGVDALLDPLSGTSDLNSESEIYPDTTSATRFLTGVEAGDDTTSTYQTLQTLVGGGGQVNVRVDSPGVFEFEVRSKVPTIKYLDATDKAQGVGVAEQDIYFDISAVTIDNNGNPSAGLSPIGNKRDTFVFKPVVESQPEITDTQITWGDVANITTSMVTEPGVTASNLRYFFYTPITEYVLKKLVDNEPAFPGPDGVYDNEEFYDQPFLASQTTFAVSSPKSDATFKVDGGGIGGSTSIGLGSQVQYTVAGLNVRHPSLTTAQDRTDPNTFNCATSGFTECYSFTPDVTARFIGADIEGSVRSQRNNVLIYEVDDGAVQSGSKTGYAGEVSNLRIRDELARNVAAATNNPASGSYLQGGADKQLSSLDFANHDVIIVEDADVVLNTNIPSGKKTLIVINGNVFVGADMTATANDSFGVIVTNEAFEAGVVPDTGHIIVAPSVGSITGTFYADGSFIGAESASQFTALQGATTVDSIAYDAVAGKENQLVLTGVIWSSNTLGGSLIQTDLDGDTAVDEYITPWNAQGTEDLLEAQKYDMHFVRRYTPSGSGTASSTAGANTNAFVIRLDYKASDTSKVPPVFAGVSNIAR